MLLGRFPPRPLADPEAGIVLRPWRATVADATALAASWRDPVVVAANAPPADRTVASALSWLQSDVARREAGVALDLVVAPEGDADAVLGEVGLRNPDPVARRAEIGWWIGPDHRGQGLATAAVRLLAGWALGPPCYLRQVWARIDPANAPSAAVARRAGFARLGAAAGADVWARSTSGVPPRSSRPPGTPERRG